jgi:hypothetical protein
MKVSPFHAPPCFFRDYPDVTGSHIPLDTLMTQQIRLSKGRVALVDDADYDALVQYRWRVNSKGYAIRSYTVNGKEIVLCMHRVILSAQPGEYVDHIDNDRLNNVRSNLRLCTQTQNLANRGLHRNNSTGYKGVNVQRGKWHARIQMFGHAVHLGMYKDAELAALVYDAAARMLYAEYARVNFPDRPTDPATALLVRQYLVRDSVLRLNPSSLSH